MSTADASFKTVWKSKSETACCRLFFWSVKYEYLVSNEWKSISFNLRTSWCIHSYSHTRNYFQSDGSCGWLVPSLTFFRESASFSKCSPWQNLIKKWRPHSQWSPKLMRDCHNFRRHKQMKIEARLKIGIRIIIHRMFKYSSLQNWLVCVHASEINRIRGLMKSKLKSK